MKLANKIQFDLIDFCTGNSDIVLPNFYVGSWEMDVFKLTKSGFIVEYEIKISRSDFKADFKKHRNELPEDWRERMDNGENMHQMERVAITKHNILEERKSASNRFFFVTTEGLLSVDEIPKYAGLIEYTGSWFRVIKNAPLLHKNKNDTPEFMTRLAHSCSFRERRWRHKVKMLEYKLKRDKKNNEL